MTLELSEHEIKLLDEALLAWERDPERDAAMGSIMKSILKSTLGQDDDIEAMKNSMRDGAVAGQQRRIQATLLRAKLFQVLARASEHSC
jgi:hypothetical protein